MNHSIKNYMFFCMLLSTSLAQPLDVINYLRSLFYTPSSFQILESLKKQAHQDLDKKQSLDGKQLYKDLNSNNKSFTIGTGIGLSQTVYNTADTIVNPNYMRSYLQQFSLQQKDPYNFLKQQEWYALTSLPEIICLNKTCNRKINFYTIKNLSDAAKTNLLTNIAENVTKENKTLTVTKCPYCSGDITTKEQEYKQLTKDYQKQLAQQVKDLGSLSQKSGPTCRLSLEIADILKDNSDEIDENKLKELSEFIESLGNPLLFIHHYTNPRVKPYLFEDEKDIDWFANICQKIIEKCDKVTHVCPISQPIGYALKVANQHNQPPFICNIPTGKFLKNIADAQTAAAKAIRTSKPHVKILLSHQWKPMRPLHTQYYDPRCGFETLICKIADSMYNQKFVSLFNDPARKDYFDGIALSIYPALMFNLWSPTGSNCSGIIDSHAALDSIVEIYKNFPSKPIYIVEAGCNCNDSTNKKIFINTALQVCKLAQDMNIDIKSCYFWGHTNDINFYREWNAAPGSTYFGLFDTIEPTSINGAGKHIQEILSHTP